MEDILHAFGVNWKLLTIQIVNFGLLLFLLHRYLYKPLFKAMEERQKRIREGLEHAEGAKKEKAEIARAKEGIIAEARREGDSLIKNLRGKAEEEGRQIVEEAEMRAAKIIKEGETLGARKKEEIVNQSKDELAKLAVKAAEEILRSRKA